MMQIFTSGQALVIAFTIMIVFAILVSFTPDQIPVVIFIIAIVSTLLVLVVARFKRPKNDREYRRGEQLSASS